MKLCLKDEKTHVYPCSKLFSEGLKPSVIIFSKSYDMLLSKNSQSDKSIEIKERIFTNCVLLTLVQSEQSLSIKNDQKQDVLPTKDMEKHSSGQNKNERGDL